MSVDVQRTLDFGNARKIINLPDGTNPQDPATVAQLNAAVEGVAWKDSSRVSTQGNLNLASPGATIDGITMAANDRVLVRAQTSGTRKWHLHLERRGSGDDARARCQHVRGTGAGGHDR